MTVVTDRYEPALAEARSLLGSHEALRELLAPECSPELFHLWMIRFSGHGVRMTERVSEWIGAAGRRCTLTGMPELGRNLCAHARAEAGHEVMMMDDARVLVDKWNRSARLPLDAEELITAPPLESARRYAALHDEVIAGDRPYGQVAIEFEIERMSVVIGPQFLEQCHRLLGSTGSTFIAEHVELDQGHTAFNERQLADVIEAGADVEFLVATGVRAIETYVSFMEECLVLARRDLELERSATGAATS